MAGSINLSLSQQFDITNGRLLSGGKLYFYSAGTSTPQLVYQDQALTIPYSNPIILGSDGRVPAFYAADGSIRARLTNRAGVRQFDTDNIMVVGPSSGSGGGSSVDATTIFQTGDQLWVIYSGTRSGWVRMNGRTMGSASSGATERANADTSALYSYLWGNFTDAQCPVATGRGLSAAADFAANKAIGIYDMRGKGPFGLDAMGNTRANTIPDASITGLGTTGDTAGATVGSANVTLSLSQMAAHDHGGATGAHSHNSGNFLLGTTPANTNSGVSFSVAANVTTGAAMSSETASIASAGGGAAHNNLSPGALGTWYCKL